MNRKIDVLYLTHNGVTDHIGQSQIAPYCMRLAEMNYRIHIVSVEKPGRDLLIARYRAEFASRGITWSFVRYHNSPPLVSQFYDMAVMRRLAFAIAKREQPRLVHCRSYLPIGIGRVIKRRFGAKLLIDFRHFWVEAGLEDSPYKFVYRLFKRREPLYFAAADHVVALTKRATRILQDWYPSTKDADHYTVIPCCADFSHFDTRRVSNEQTQALRERLSFGAEDPILIYLGSIGPDYLVEEMMALFVELKGLRPTARFLFVSNNGQDRVEAVRRVFGLPADSICFVTASRDEVPAYLAISDMSVFFYRADLSRAGCSPTKLAELLAANVPVIGNTGVGDLDEILSMDKNCSVVVPDFRPQTLKDALELVLAVTPERRAHIREDNRVYDLNTGAARYQSVYERLIRPPSIHPATQAAETRPC